MEDLFQDGMEEFVTYQKDENQIKIRQEKRKEKLRKFRAEVEDPAYKKQRQDLRKKQAKAKFRKQLEGKSKEQCKLYLDKKFEEKRQTKQKVLKGLEHGIPILIDAVFENVMNEKQNKSLAIQVELIMKAVKHLEDPPGIYLCSVGGSFEAQLKKMRSENWVLKQSTDNILEVAKKINKKPVYLSPDAEDELSEIDPEAAYIIGGLVDRTVIKNASLDRANELHIPAKKLPILAFMKNRKCLNLDHVVMILSKFKETGDWKVAFDYGAPKRWKKDVPDRIRRANKQDNLEKQESSSSEEQLPSKEKKQEEELFDISEQVCKKQDRQ